MHVQITPCRVVPTFLARMFESLFESRVVRVHTFYYYCMLVLTASKIITESTTLREQGSSRNTQAVLKHQTFRAVIDETCHQHDHIGTCEQHDAENHLIPEQSEDDDHSTSVPVVHIQLSTHGNQHFITSQTPPSIT
jgi:hypothetical protein